MPEPTGDAVAPAESARRLLVTRPAAQAAGWVARLLARGVDAAALPLIDIAAPRDPARVSDAWSALARQQLLVFVSPNAVERFFAARPVGAGWPSGLAAGAPGPGTRDALVAMGVPAEAVIAPAADAAQFDSESLWQQMQQRAWHGASVLIVRGDGGREWLAEQLIAAGAQVEFLGAYTRRPAVLAPAEQQLLRCALAQPARHAWLFSSSEAIDHLLPIAASAADAQRRWPQRATALATHPAIEARARAAGFGTVVGCRPTLDGVVACLQSPAAAESPPSSERTAIPDAAGGRPA